MPETIQRSFTAGELSPNLHARADLSKYTNGLALCENFIVRSQGGVVNRPGTRFIGEIRDSSKKARLIPFQFNTEQTYILVFEHLTMRVIKDGGFVLDGAGPALFEIATPYTEAQLSRLNFTQSADVMTICHPDHEIRNLSRTDHDEWSLDVVDYSPTIDPPTFTLNFTGALAILDILTTKNAVVTVSAAGLGSNPLRIGQSIKLNTSTSLPEVDGRIFTIKTMNYSVVTEEIDIVLLNTDFREYSYTSDSGDSIVGLENITTVGSGEGDFDKDYQYVITAVDGNGVESLQSSSQYINTKSLSVTAGIRLSWDSVAGADYYRVYKLNSVNTEVYGWIGDSNTTTFDDYNIAPLTSDGPPIDRQPLDSANNYPACVTYYQQRQIFANTFNEPQSVYTTQTGNYQSFRVSQPTRADDAVTFTVASRQVNEIRHLVSLDSLIILTSGGEWLVTEGQDQVLTPSTLGVRIQSYNGSSWVTPAVIDDTVLYVQDKGTKVRDLKYSFNDDKYSGNDLSIMAQHLFEDYEVVEMAYADEPYGVLWVVRSDGRLLGLTYQREHQVWAWHQHVTNNGEVESVAVISEDGRDATYITVKRTIDGSIKRYVERIEPRITSDVVDSFFVDSGLTYDGTPADVISGLDHLEGETVIALADGVVVKNLTVSSGSITLPQEFSKVHIGLPYTASIETLDLDAASLMESLKAKDINVNKITIDMLKSRSGYAGAVLEDGTYDMQELKPRFDTDGYGAIQLKTYKADVTPSPDWEGAGQIRIEQRDPLPMEVLSVIPEVDISG